MPFTAGPLPGHDNQQIRDVEQRLEDIASAIQEFAALRFGARAPVGPDGDIVDAVAAGVNFLGEELEASYGEIERKVADRTAELVVATQELGRRALHDALTGLPNRTLFWDRLSMRLNLADRRETGFAVLFVDLDNFKEVNDTLGHAVGDRLLVDVTSRIREALRVGDSAARMGGDEFLVLLDDVATPEAALGVADRLSESLGEPYELGTGPRIVTASIGVVVSPDGVESADAVVAAADAAMYDAKRRGRGQCVLYSEDRHGKAGKLPLGDGVGANQYESRREVPPD